MRGSRRRASSARARPGLARLRGSRAWRLEDAWPDEGVTYDFTDMGGSTGSVEEEVDRVLP